MDSNNFFAFWYEGFEKGLERISEKERCVLLNECAQACSRSYSLEVYRKAYADSADIDGFLHSLQDVFSELSYAISKDKKTVTIIYDHCACELYTRGLVTSGLLCECSRRSLQHNWESVMGEGSVEVAMKQSILQGQERCVFEVKVK